MPKRKTAYQKLGSYNYSPRETIAEKKKKAYRKVALISVLTIIISFFLIQNASEAIDKIIEIGKKDDTADLTTPTSIEESQNKLLWQPKINPLPSITNQKKITITGTIYQGVQAELFFNGNSLSVDDVDENKNFEFTDLNLSSGENTIAIKAINENGDRSELSETSKVTLDLKPPTLEILEPENNKTFTENKISILGTVEENAKLYINDHMVIIKPDDSFSYNVTLEKGENQIQIKAIDEAENETQMTITAIFEFKTEN